MIAIKYEGSSSDAVATVLDCDIEVSEFVLQLCYSVDFQADTPYPPVMSWRVWLLFFDKNGFGIE